MPRESKPKIRNITALTGLFGDIVFCMVKGLKTLCGSVMAPKAKEIREVMRLPQIVEKQESVI